MENVKPTAPPFFHYFPLSNLRLLKFRHENCDIFNTNSFCGRHCDLDQGDQSLQGSQSRFCPNFFSISSFACLQFLAATIAYKLSAPDHLLAAMLCLELLVVSLS
jgi:hypothetical protein